MHKEVRRILLIVVASIFLIVGLVGLVLPFLQGILFLIISLILFSIASPQIRDWTEVHTRKYPRIHKTIEKMRGRIVRIIGE